jgi:alkanesulfonate monooxygenase SsuD/methylene tetrahydromethanopterin reductase-like flavin-dependent oxidoreductase (luciferase family)
MTTAPRVSIGTLDLTVDAPTLETVRIQASDLAEAQAQRSRLRQDFAAAGHDPDQLAVILDVDTHIAADARTARKDLANSVSVPAPQSLLYVGTASGLAGLIADIKAADVADGVNLHPILEQDQVRSRIVDDVLPVLAARGAVLNSEAVAGLAQPGSTRKAS